MLFRESVALLLSLLLFGIVGMQARSRAAAEVLTGELWASEETLKKTNDELRTKIRERQDAEDALTAAADAYDKGKQAGRDAAAVVKEAKAALR